jgi:polysaccharide biosynthesis transport protein
MNLELFLTVLRARLGLFFMVVFVTVLAATVVSLVMPRAYRATASLLVDAKDEQQLNNALRPLMLPQERMYYMQTQMDVIGSQKVARKVVRDLKFAEDADTRAKFVEETGGVGAIEDWLAELLLLGLKVETSQSNIISVTYTSRDSERAAAIANAFARAYIDTMLELRVMPVRQAAAWFDEQLKTLRAQLEAAQVKLTDYHRKHGIVATDESRDVENARLADLTSQLVKAQDQTFDWKVREDRAREFAAKGVSPDRLPDVLSNVHIQKLNSDLNAAEAKLQELGTQYGANYPSYQRLASEVQALRQRLNAEMKKVVSGMENARHQASQREAELRREIASQRTRLLDSKVSRNDLNVLQRDVETAQKTYDAAQQRFVATQVESRANETNVSVLTPAVAPRLPFRPKIPLNIALAVVVGSMLGIGIVVLGEMMDRRVRLRTDLDHGITAPLLAILNARPSAAPRLLGRSSARALPSPG